MRLEALGSGLDLNPKTFRRPAAPKTREPPEENNLSHSSFLDLPPAELSVFKLEPWQKRLATNVAAQFAKSVLDPVFGFYDARELFVSKRLKAMVLAPA